MGKKKVEQGSVSGYEFCNGVVRLPDEVVKKLDLLFVEGKGYLNETISAISQRRNKAFTKEEGMNYSKRVREQLETRFIDKCTATLPMKMRANGRVVNFVARGTNSAIETTSDIIPLTEREKVHLVLSLMACGNIVEVKRLG